MISFSCGYNFLAIVATLIAILFAYFNWKFKYWQRRNLQYLKPEIPNPFRLLEYVGSGLKNQYDIMKAKGWKHGGFFFFTNPTYMAVDLDYIKNIMAKDFQYFSDRGVYYNEKDDPLSAHLFAIGGQKWRNLRTKLTPTFTSGKMKMMFHTLTECIPNLLEKIEPHRVSQTPVDIKEILGCFTTDIIGSCAFGLDCNTIKEENSPFREYGRKAMRPTPLQMLRVLFTMICPNIARTLRMTLLPKDVSSFFKGVVRDTINYRETNEVIRNDFLQILIDLKNKASESLTLDEIAAQCFVFFLAGFETSSTTMTCALYELARNSELQEHLRSEINTVLHKFDGKITYEAMQEMKYMDQVINETLRMYPPVLMITRMCVKDYKIPDEDVIIEEGTSVMIPVLAVHYDQEYYAEPEKFDPERFSEDNKKMRHQYAHIPFGEGPRICIGMRFGLMQTKVGLAALLKQYRFGVSEKTQNLMKMRANSFILPVEGDILLSVERV